MAANSLSPVRVAVIDAIRKGNHTVNALAALLGVSDNAVRLQLGALERDGLIRRRGVVHSGQAGQPAVEYDLTESGETALSKAYQPALIALVSALGARLPNRALRALFEDAGRRMGVETRIGPHVSLSARAHACGALIESLGGSATVSVNRNHASVRGTSCPLAAAVRAEPGTCFIVEALLERHAGVKAVQRCEHGPQPRCHFEIKQV